MRYLAIALTVATCASSFLLAADSQHATQLVTQLGSSKYKEREAAFRALEELGEAGLTDLRAGTSSPDMEIARRSRELIRKIEQRIAAAKILTPTMVTIDIVDLPLSEAQSKFRTQLGNAPSLTPGVNWPNLPIQLTSSVTREKAASRKVTYRTSGKVSVWTALDGFCKAANVTEWDGVTQLPGMPMPVASQTVEMRQAGIIQRRAAMRVTTAQVRDILLYDGTPTPLPTCDLGAARVRLLSALPPNLNATVDADEFILPLQISLESKINWQSTPTVKMAQATDDRGQRLNASVIGAVSVREWDDDMIFMGNPGMMPQTQAIQGPRSQYVGLRFRRGLEPSKVLREVTGTLSLPFRTQGELMSIHQPGASGGKLARNEIGTSMTLHGIEKIKDDHLKVDVAFETCGEVMPAMSGLPQQGGQFQVQNGRIIQQIHTYNQAIDGVEYLGISAFDHQGKKLTIWKIQEQNFSLSTDGLQCRMSLLFKAPLQPADIAKLTFSANYPLTIETAIAFKDIPVP